MAGKFKVVGVFRLTGRGLVAYGDVVDGTVARGEILAIRLNSSMAISPLILSVEMVDGTATGSHVGLLISSSDELEMDLVEALNLADETLDVAPAKVDPEAATFDEAVTRLRDLLAAIGWPAAVTWVANEDVIAFPNRVYVFRPQNGEHSTEAARQAFAFAMYDFAAARVGAIGHRKGVTFASVWPIEELAQGEEMFIERRVKVDAPSITPRVIPVRFRWRWSLLKRAHRAWRERAG